MIDAYEKAFNDVIVRGTFTSNDVRTAVLRAGCPVDECEAVRQELMETAEHAGLIRRSGETKWVKVP